MGPARRPPCRPPALVRRASRACAPSSEPHARNTTKRTRNACRTPPIAKLEHSIASVKVKSAIATAPDTAYQMQNDLARAVPDTAQREEGVGREAGRVR